MRNLLEGQCTLVPSATQQSCIASQGLTSIAFPDGAPSSGCWLSLLTLGPDINKETIVKEVMVQLKVALRKTHFLHILQPSLGTKVKKHKDIV